MSMNPNISRQVIYEGLYTLYYPSIAVISETGYRGAVGMNYKLLKGWQISVEGLLEKTTIHTNQGAADFNCNGWGVLANIGYTFGRND
jgi:hypothetical protein